MGGMCFCKSIEKVNFFVKSILLSNGPRAFVRSVVTEELDVCIELVLCNCTLLVGPTSGDALGPCWSFL